MKNDNIELLAPAGSTESFISAVEAGADAVYVGLKNFSARAKAKNFSYIQLKQLTEYAKNKNVKTFVTLNTLIKQDEISKLLDNLEQIAGIADAVIVQDFGIIKLVKKYFPSLKLHASTQLAVHNSFGAASAKKLGFSRVVLARELSYNQLKQIRKSSDLELEVFCHGALCFCVSGLCLFSSIIGGYSGNRGHCTQPCRRLWMTDKKSGFFISPKDLQLSRYIKRLKELGINSLKIEGRMKNDDYVYKTVKAYRLLINAKENDLQYADKQASELLDYDFAREKTSFNFIEKSIDIFAPEKSKTVGLYAGVVANKTENTFTLQSAVKLEPGDTLRIINAKSDKSVVLNISDIKSDNNIYEISYDNLYIEKGFEVFKTAQKHNRNFDVKISDSADLEKKTKNINCYAPKFSFSEKLPGLLIRVDNIKWLPLLDDARHNIVIKINETNIKLPDDFKNKQNYYFELPAYIDEERLSGFQNIISVLVKNGNNKFFINNISHFNFFEKLNADLYAGQFLYTLNCYSADLLSDKFNIKAFASSWEDDLQNIMLMSKFIKDKMIVYLFGFAEIAISKMIFREEIKNKKMKSDKDEFKVISDGYKNILIPKFPVSIFNLKNNFLKAGIKSFGADLSYIEPDKKYIELLLKAFNGNAYIGSDYKFNMERKLK